mmetsp:Transcript_5947/g.7625  ORF Transcript_5947/g.7625 Transcript_5947/m.7625 type:complete len:227 (-) Transcript_5947:210-890(-)
MRPQKASRPIDFKGSALSTTASNSLTPSIPNIPTTAGPRAPLALNIKAGFPPSPCTNVTNFVNSLTLNLDEVYDITTPLDCSSSSRSHSLTSPVSSQQARNRPSPLKSASRISFVFSPHFRSKVGGTFSSPAFHSCRMPSVPPVTIVAASGENLAKFCSGSLPAASVSHSQSSVNRFASSSSFRAMQPLPMLASQTPTSEEYVMRTTTRFPVFKEAIVVNFPVSSS